MTLNRRFLEYEAIIREGAENGVIYFNIANSYFKSGELGKAILNYERAKRFIPRDSDLKFNENYALSEAGSLESSSSLNFIEKLMLKHYQFYSKEEMVMVITAIAIIGAYLYLIALFGKWPLGLKRKHLCSPGNNFCDFCFWINR